MRFMIESRAITLPRRPTMRRSKYFLCYCLVLAAIALFLFAGCATKTDPTAANKQVVIDSLAAMDKQDYARCRELWPMENTEHKFVKIVGMPDMNREEVIGFLTAYWKAFPDTKHIIHDIIAEGDTVVAHTTCSGTQREEFQGLPASGTQVNYQGVHIVKFANGKIREWWAMDDNMGMMQQLGMELKPREVKK
jgi:steroid delta-isomerase-like uncharacterized protein